MKTNKKIIWFLLLAPPIMGEFITGNRFNLIYKPMAFIAFFGMSILLYGCGTLLIRELKVRWVLQWSLVFLLIAYGIYEEGFTTKAFFNVDWAGASEKAGYGMYFGVRWVWAIGVTFAHATISTLFALVVSDYLWPEFRTTSLLKKKGWFFSLLGFITVGIFGFITMGASEVDVWTPFFPGVMHIIGTILAIVLLVFAAYHYRNSRFASTGKVFPPFVFGLLGFLVQTFFIFSYLFAKSGVPAPINLLAYFLVLFLVFLFMKFQIYNVNTTKRHIVALAVGTVLMWILLAPIHELQWGHTGITVLLLVFAILVWKWRKKVLKTTAVDS